VFFTKSKVFRYFIRLDIVVNLKIIVPVIFVIIIAGAIAFNLEQEIVEEEIIEEVKWRTSGPFQIEKEEYYLGEKIFINVNNIPKEVSGEIIFFRPAVDGINKYPKEFEGISPELISTKVKYLGIEFDGKNKENFNRYFEPRLSEWKGICSTDQIVGEWIMTFSGTSYEPIHFTVLNYTMPGDTRTFEPLVDIANC
jgi:hypothetical protein